MTYLLDTNAVTDVMSGSHVMDEWLAALAQDDRVVTCTIVRGEILFGISRLPVGRRRTELEERSRRTLSELHCEPIPERAADFYAVIKAVRRQRGMPLDENDLWIAATALALAATLVSRDTDFAGIEGLQVVAPV